MNRSDVLLFGLYLLLAFTAGFFVSAFLGITDSGGITGRSVDVPSDHFTNNDILVYEDKVVIKVSGARITNYDSTGSMLPTLDENVNGISVEPENTAAVNVGDIVSFWRDDVLIVHRVIEKGTDEHGLYFITKGDNAPTDDGKIRFEEIEHVLVGLVY